MHYQKKLHHVRMEDGDLMRRRIIDYRQYVDQLLMDVDAQYDWNTFLIEHLQQISFFQHERLIHLIVTLTFSLLTIIIFIAMLFTNSVVCYLLCALLTILLLPYIIHYYILENEVQKMYVQYDEIIKKIKKRLINELKIIFEAKIVLYGDGFI